MPLLPRVTSLTRVRIDRSALKKDSGTTIAEGAVDHIGVSRDPADVCHTAKDVPVLVVKHILNKKRETVRGFTWACTGKGHNKEQCTLSTLMLLCFSVFLPPLQGHLPAKSFKKNPLKNKIIK